MSTSQQDLEDQRRRQRSLEAELIVKRLATRSEPVVGPYEDGVCLLCDKINSHLPECPWRWARDWAAAHDTG